MLIRTLLILAIITSKLSCNNKSAELQRKNEIYKIVFATGGCYGTCPVQVFSIDSSLTFNYHGIAYTDNKGFYTGTIDRALFDTINMKFEDVNYKQLDTVYSGTADDLSTELYIYYGDKVKHISSARNDLPKAVKPLYEWLLTLPKKVTLKKTNDSLKFETRIEKIPAFSDTIIFTPPEIDK